MHFNTISVVIPTRNRQQLLEKAIQSVASQSVLPGELIIVDDGSDPPAGESIFSGVPGGVQRILLRNPIATGAPRARNLGVRQATGEWIAFLDDDDAFFPHKIEAVKQVILENQDADVIYHPAEINMVQEKARYRSGTTDLNKGSGALRQLLIRNVAGGASMAVVKRSAFLKAGGFDEKMPALQDWELWINMAKQNMRFVFFPDPLTHYCHNTSQQSITMVYETMEQAFARLEEKYVADYEALSRHEKKLYDMNKLKNKVFKALLHHNRKAAFTTQGKLFLKSLSPSDLFALLLMPLGAKAVFTARSWLQ